MFQVPILRCKYLSFYTEQNWSLHWRALALRWKYPILPSVPPNFYLLFHTSSFLSYPQTACVPDTVLVADCNFYAASTRLASSVAVHLSCRSSSLSFVVWSRFFAFPGCHRCHLPLSTLYLFMANWASAVQLGLCLLTLFVFCWVLKGWFYLLSKTFSFNMLLWPKQFQKLTVIVSSPFPGVPFSLKIQKCLLFEFRYGR